jgi:hypothetical protein
MFEPSDAKNSLKLLFESTAEWRRGKARDYPRDRRNLMAAELLDRLAVSVDAIRHDFVAAYAELHDDGKDGHRIAELENEKCRLVGFHDWPESAEDFMKSIIAEMVGPRRVGVAL